MGTSHRRLVPPSLREGNAARAAGAHEPQVAWRFGSFELDGADRILRSGGRPMDLGARGFDVLVALLRKAGHLVTKEELLGQVWPDVVVEESNIQVQVSALRKVLGRDAITTVAGHGYRFELPVERIATQPAAGGHIVKIPQPLSSLVGREAEIESVCSLLESHRLVTLKGAGGIGKTRLATSVGHELARSIPGNIWFVDLSAQHDGVALPSAILASIGASADAQSMGIETLKRRLGQGAALLILDNCEQVIDSVAAICRALLEGCPALKFLCTSREPLRIAGEVVFPVPPLSEAESYALFAARAQAASPSLRDSPESRPLIEIVVRRLDGISLALELAAARLRGMSLKSLATQIDNRFQVLTGGDRTALPRHQALRATMEWSYQLLSAPEQQLFRRLAVFNGPFGLEDVAAVAITGDNADTRVLDILTGLVDKSLVQSDPDSPEHGYSLFELTRAFAHEELEDSGEVERIRTHHFEHYRDRVVAAHASHDTVEWSTRRDALLPAYSNVTAALRWALLEEHDLEGGCVVAESLIYFWVELGLYDEGERWLSLVQGRLSRLPPLTAARALLALGGLFQERGRLDQAGQFLTDCVSIYAGLDGCREEWAIACNQLGVTLLYKREYEGARVMFENALPVYREIGHRQREARALNNLAVVHVAQDEIDLAEPMLREALPVIREAGNKQTESVCLKFLADCAYSRGAPAEALKLAGQALDFRRPLRDSVSVASVRSRIASFAAESGDIALARHSILESLRISAVVRNVLGVRECFDTCARLSLAAARPTEGVRMSGFVTSWMGSIDGPPRSRLMEREAMAVARGLRVALGPAEYDRQFELGSHLALDDAFALARSIAESLPG